MPRNSLKFYDDIICNIDTKLIFLTDENIDINYCIHTDCIKKKLKKEYCKEHYLFHYPDSKCLALHCNNIKNHRTKSNFCRTHYTIRCSTIKCINKIYKYNICKKCFISSRKVLGGVLVFQK